MTARPVLIPEVGPETLLEQVPLTGPVSRETYSEDWLQDLIFRHPRSLPVADIDESYGELVPVCRELPTGAGPVDVLYMTKVGRPVLVEAKLWRNPEARRKVVAQILDYAKELSRWSFDRLDSAVRRTQSTPGGAPRGLLDIMGIGRDTPEASTFHDGVTKALRRGDFMLLIVGDGIRDGAGAITEFLDTHASLHFTFGLVEMGIFRVPSGGLLVQPRVLLQTDIVRRVVVELSAGNLMATDADGEDRESESTPDEQGLTGFWTGFLAKLRLDDTSQPVNRPARGSNQFFSMPKGSDSWVSAYLAGAGGHAGVYVSLGQGAIPERIYTALQEERAAVEKDLGIPARWETEQGRHRIVSTMPFDGSVSGEHAEHVQLRLSDWTNRYVNAFRPRIERLLREIG